MPQMRKDVNPVARKHKTELKYMEIYRHLRNAIRARAYCPGDQLPSEGELCREYAVNRATVRHALKLLVGDGLITKRPGKGSYVRSASDKIIIEIDPAHLNNPVIADLLYNAANADNPR